MVDYGAAFKLPFTNLRRFSVFLALGFFALIVPAFVFVKFYLQLMGSFVAVDAVPDATGVFSGLNLGILALSLLALVVFGLASTGYMLRTTGYAARGKNILPPFDNVIGLFTVALKYIAGIIVYIVIIYALFIIAGLLFMLPGLLKLLGVLLIIPLIILYFMAMYALPMLMTHFASENRFAAFFELGKARKYAFTMAYFVPWLVALGYSSIAGTVAYFVVVMLAVALLPVSLLAAVIVGLTLYLFSYSVMYITIVNLYGQAYHEVSTHRSKAGGN